MPVDLDLDEIEEVAFRGFSARDDCESQSYRADSKAAIGHCVGEHVCAIKLSGVCISVRGSHDLIKSPILSKRAYSKEIAG